MTSSFFRVVKALRAIWATLFAVLKLRFHLQSPEVIKRKWGEKIFSILDCDVQIRGHAHQGPCLLVANHVGYLDIVALLYAHPPTCLVSKAEVKNFPLIGRGAIEVGTIFVNRSSLRSRAQSAEAIAQAVGEGKTVGIFPEGTSTLLGRPFRKGAFRVARDHNLVIQPVVINYFPHETVVYESIPFVKHCWNLLGRNDLRAEIEFLEIEKVQELIQDSGSIEGRVRSRLKEKIFLSMEA